MADMRKLRAAAILFCVAAMVITMACSETDAKTWTDPASCLTWQVTPTGGKKTWSYAKSHCAGLSLDGYKDWRLPTIDELRTLIRGCPSTITGGSCNVEEGDCLAWPCRDNESRSVCPSYHGPGEGGCYWPDEMEGTCIWYWSSSSVGGGEAWAVNFDYGHVYNDGTGVDLHVRCVRDSGVDTNCLAACDCGDCGDADGG